MEQKNEKENKWKGLKGNEGKGDNKRKNKEINYKSSKTEQIITKHITILKLQPFQYLQEREK